VSIPAQQAEVADLLGRLTGARPILTHISAVFVGPGDVFKLKQAVALEFLDFSTLAARERFIRREYALNQGFAQGLYRGVLPVTRGPGGALRLGGAGPAEDWVLHMAPVPEADFLDAMARREALTPALLDQLADKVAAMHATLPPLPGTDAAAAMRRVLAGNLAAAERAGEVEVDGQTEHGTEGHGFQKEARYFR
jgi:aminoglycoside phosphotransferase family enzyme